MARWLAIVDDDADLDDLRDGVKVCRACPLWRDNHGGVCSEGPRHAALVLIGEQPGDQEDRQQRVFVGPAGRVLDDVIADAGLDRAGLYLTNAVKHFAHLPPREPGGKRRLHRRPTAAEIEACRPWLQGELRALRPRVIVLLGAVATASLLGPLVQLTAVRGSLLRTDQHLVLPTWHPSAVLRTRAFDPAAATRLRRQLVDDLATAAAVAHAADSHAADSHAASAA